MKIGIIGGGQLCLMMIEEIITKNLQHDIIILDPDENCPASKYVNKQIIGNYKDINKIRELAQKSDLITYELEHTSSKALNILEEEGYKIYPSPKTLKIINNKFKQKKFLKEQGFLVSDFKKIENENDLIKISKKFKFPLILKRKFNSYDGKGNYLIEKPEDIKPALSKFKNKRVYAEKIINFKKELSIICAKDVKGNIALYPISENIHQKNVLKTTISPAHINKEIKIKIEKIAKKLLNTFDTIGVFGIEMFLDQNNKILINEIAPRVHNTGHHTLDASKTSQFEQHIRAITSMPLGETTTKPSIMHNILGNDNGYIGEYEIEVKNITNDIKVHLYGKKIAKPNRKLGHITIINENENSIKLKELIHINPLN